jgi:hypothetical protein
MADTLRKPTASFRSAEHGNASEPLATIHTLDDLGPFSSTAATRTCQESAHRLLICEPVISQIGDAVDIVFQSHLTNNGSTVSVSKGNLAGKQLYALSLFPDRTVELDDPPTWRQIFIFALQNADVILRPGCAIGSWYNRRRNMHVLDPVVCVSNLQAALELAQCFDQQSIYDLERGREIEIPYRSSIAVPHLVEELQ